MDEKSHEPLLSILSLVVETAVKLRKDGHKVVIVSSGAIGIGLRRMDVDKRPKHLSRLQAWLPPPRRTGPSCTPADAGNRRWQPSDSAA